MTKDPIRLYCKVVEKGNKNQHIVPSNNGWSVKKGLSNKVTKKFSTKKEAIEHGKEIARNQKTELILKYSSLNIHN